MLVLYETPAGYALFNMKKEEKLKDVEQLAKSFEDPETASKLVTLKAFHKFANTSEALEAATALLEGKLEGDLKKFLRSNVSDGDKLAVADSKLAASILKKIKVEVVSDAAVHELFRGIRGQALNLIEGLAESDVNAMSLGLSHSLSRHKLKLSAEKVDTMIIQAISLLDELDKELNTYSMRLKEWYGWHFPELTKLVVDNLVYARTVRVLQFRTNAATADLAQSLPEALIAEVRAAAEVSMGTEISEEDMSNIDALAKQVVDMAEYRAELYEYLRNRMNAIAPNLTAVVGELVGARLIAHSGSLVNLAKHPSSTVQILGAEKALFRALKTKHDTPKYGLIYHASVVGQAGPKLKGKISRVLAAKTSLAARVDAFRERPEEEEGEEERGRAILDIGLSNRLKVEERLRELEAISQSRLSGAAKAPKSDKRYDFTKSKTYNPNDDFQMNIDSPIEKKADDKKEKKSKDDKKAKEDSDGEEVKEEKKEKEDKKEKKEKKEKKAKEEKKRLSEEVESETKSKKKSKKE